MSAGADRQVCDMLRPLYLSLSVLWDLAEEYGGREKSTVICSARSRSVLWDLTVEIGIYFGRPFCLHLIL